MNTTKLTTNSGNVNAKPIAEKSTAGTSSSKVITTRPTPQSILSKIQRPERYEDNLDPESNPCQVFTCYTDSMDPKIAPGSKIFCRKIEDWREVLEFGKIYLIGLPDGRGLIYYIRAGKTREEFLLVPENTKRYDAQPILKSLISDLWLIEGWVTRHG